MRSYRHRPLPRDDEPPAGPTLVLVRPDPEDERAPAPRAPRERPPLPTLHLAAHEIVSLAPPEPDEPA